MTKKDAVDIEFFFSAILSFMEQNDTSHGATKKDIENLKKYLDRNFVTKKDLFSTKDDLLVVKEELQRRIDVLELRTDEKAQKYRDSVLTAIAGVMKELEGMREDRIIGSHQTLALQKQVGNHEKRIKRLEQTHQVV